MSRKSSRDDATPAAAREPVNFNRRRILRRIAVVMVAGANSICLGFYLLLLVARSLGLAEQSYDASAASQAVAQIMSGALKPAANGMVALPPALKSASLHGAAYVTIDPAGTTWILFQTWQGKNANLRGHLYHSTPAPSPPPTTVSVLGPVIGDTQMIDYRVEAQEGANWYRVVWDLD